MRVEMPPSPGEEREKGHHQEQEPHGPCEGRTQHGIGKELLVQKSVPGITSDEAPKHCPSSSPRAGHFYHGSHSPSELGYRVYVP